MNIITGYIIGGMLAITSYMIPNTTTVSIKDLEVYKLGDVVPQEYIDKEISKYASGTKAYQIKRTIFCESNNTNVQSNIIKDGVRENSWGIAQINLYWNPQVSKEQALNPEFAIKFMSDNWGKIKWYGYVDNSDTCNIIYK